jgi:hypothetical protein
MEKSEGVAILTDAQAELAKANTKDEALAVIRKAGKVGYKPVFRCLVNGETPENSIRWA